MHKTIGWLHLSDLHFLKQHDWRDNSVLEDLCADISSMKNDGLLIDLVFCTGDIGYGETRNDSLNNQYTNAISFFDKVLDICGLERNRLFLVPGNHDIDRNIILNAITDYFRSNERKVSDINQMFRDYNPNVKEAMKRLQNYRKFVRTHYRHIFLDENANFGTLIEINGLNIYIAGLNSAWTCVDNNDEGKLWLAGQAQLNACNKMAINTPAAEEPAIKIALMHHPIDWLNTDEAKKIRRIIQKKFDFLLHGHEHDQWVIENRIPYHIVIASGAATADSEEEFGYNLVQLSPGKANIHLREYDNKGAGWVKENIFGCAEDGIWPIVPPLALSKEDNRISDQLKAQLKQVNITIDTLTQSQFDMINWLRDYDRAAIAGCAGSGKTLLAVEKAIRLYDAGIKTLILCHNPNLANFIRILVARTTIDVVDFLSWIAQTIGKEKITGRAWIQYEEPTNRELESAFEILSNSIENNKFAAIIVDEGQDFREDWWVVVEAALRDSKKGILYIFYDDNQALLPQRCRYPIQASPFKLSKNCRNAGQIFNVVKRFHDHAPDPCSFLHGQGVFKRWEFDFGEEYSVLNEAICAALEVLHPDELVVLTTEPGPIEQSMLNNKEIYTTPFYKWQDGIKESFAKLSEIINKAQSKHPLARIVLPSLSDATFPTDNDITSISNFAKNILTFLGRNIDNPPNTIAFTIASFGLYGVHKDHIYSYERKKLEILYSFCTGDWAKHLPKLVPLKLTAGDLPNISNNPNILRLYTTASFKGLESEGIVLCVFGQQDDLKENLYVGVSRAKFLLHVVVNKQLLDRFPQLK